MTITLHPKNGKLIIIIHDNGRGFAADTILKESRGFGLKNILSRVDILKGDMYLNSDPKLGTTYTIEIPNA